ncbi:PLP-dependent aminotransferase family protein [Sneathiella chungangensis]|nr:PLP-dependent aminotransferase family protein [Sneathiella chungangensis]
MAEISHLRTVTGNRAFQQMLAASQSEHLIQLTKAYPSSDLVWTPDVHKTFRDVSRKAGPELFEYTSSAGSLDLRRAILVYVSAQGMEATTDEIIITSGAQQGLDIVTRTLMRAGDKIIMERPTYFGMLDLLRSSGIQPVTVEMLNDGVSPEALEEAIVTHGPKAFYTMPTFHNPAGVTQSLERRRQVVEICARYNLPIIEDDYAPELRFSGEPLPTLWSLAREEGNSCSVFYVRGFSKTYLPGVRLGFVLVPRSEYENVLSSRSLSTLHSSNLVQLFGVAYFKSEVWLSVRDQLVKTYSKRQSALVKSLKSNLPRTARILAPDGGLNVWLHLPDEIDATEMFYTAIRNGVSYFAGELFFADKPALNTMRVSFGALSEAEIPDAAARLGATVSQQMGEKAPSVTMVL